MISVIIPAYNEEKVIADCLKALAGQKTKQKFTVILVNNNSTDKTVKVAESFRDKLNLKILLQKQKGRGAARCLGFQYAQGSILLSTDADTIVPNDWIDRMLYHLKTSKAVAVTGTCKIVDCDRFTNTLFNLFQPLFMRFYRLIFGHYWLSGFSFAIYRNVYEKSGGFKPELNGQEDIELSFKVSKIGKIQLISNLPVIFSGRRFRKGLIKGILPYLSTFIAYFFFKKEKIVLPDIR
jgi:biofilm PGA synthesis N-glycosyltransferase PgaC